MRPHTAGYRSPEASSNWLTTYYFIRFLVAAAWAAMALLVAKNMPVLAAVMLIAYPAWDALANMTDARRNGGLSQNKTQMLNVVISAFTALAIAFALRKSLNAMLMVFGAWAVLAGLLQLATAVRRWGMFGAQWAMILSGAQSALAGLFFVKMAGASEQVGIAVVAPYAAFGAFYFLASAIWLGVRDVQGRSQARSELAALADATVATTAMLPCWLQPLIRLYNRECFSTIPSVGRKRTSAAP
ncbi:MAG: DUF308 domain-containing protein [Janthinobacterium lividum]